jgi:hypothetical protein
MISIGSLSALSSGPAPIGHPGTGPVQPVRVPGIQVPATSAPSTASRPPQGGTGSGGAASPPPRSLPRGSLLDLSV